MECVVLRGKIDGDYYGLGYGDGGGDGYYYGDGYGYGNGCGFYWRSVMTYALHSWTDTQRARFQTILTKNIPLAFWRSNANGQPSNGGSPIITAAPGVVHKTNGPLRLCENGTLHATMIPPKWIGERVWIVALHGKVIGDDEKFGCLKREILGEVTWLK